MRSEGALGKSWVRACLLVPASVIVIYGLYAVWAILVEDGHRTLGDTVGYLDFASLLAALFLGPAWVIRAFDAPTPPGTVGHSGPHLEDGVHGAVPSVSD